MIDLRSFSLRLRYFTKMAARRLFPLWYLKRAESVWRKTNPFAGKSDYEEFPGGSQFRLGIIKEFYHYHKDYIAACRELDVSYQLIDIMAPDWIERFKNSNCDAFLVWPSGTAVTYKNLYDERLKVLSDILGETIFPTYNEIWIWESKRRMRDWLVANEYPAPRTWVFYRYDEAMAFIETVELPVVIKTDSGACSSGVKIIKTRSAGRRVIRQAFRKGIPLTTKPFGEYQWGNVLFQEYLPDAEEWRMAKVAESYFGYVKLRKGEFASGSGLYHHGRPPEDVLDLTERICAKGNFNSMNLDIFKMPDGRLFVNELQSLFGATHPADYCVIDGKPGRMFKKNGSWCFEEGDFCKHQFCNLRVKYVIENLLAKSSYHKSSQ